MPLPSKSPVTGAAGILIVQGYPESSWITMETTGTSSDAPLELLWKLPEDSKHSESNTRATLSLCSLLSLEPSSVTPLPLS